MEKALVTGASRGVGRGAAIGLADAGFDVFATARTIGATQLSDGITRIVCDHLNDADTAAAFSRVGESLDVLVNSAWGGYAQMNENGVFTWMMPFWQQPAHRWTSMIDAGLRAAFVASQHAARIMVPQRRGLIVNVSFWAAQKHIGNTIYGISKAGTDKMTADMAHELSAHNVAVVSLYPGMVRTELVMEAASQGWLDITNSESPEFIGRVVAALARDPNIMQRTGQVLVAAQVAQELGVTDLDGAQPKPLTLDKV